MGLRGPLPKSAGERVHGGNAGKGDVFENARPVGKPIKTPPCPKGLDGLAKAFWKRYVPMLAAKGLITPLDEPSLTLACWLWQEYQQDMAIVAKEGRYNKGKPHPAMLQAQKAVKQLNELLKLFGMHPASRTRLGGAKEEPEKDESYSKFRRGVK